MLTKFPADFNRGSGDSSKANGNIWKIIKIIQKHNRRISKGRNVVVVGLFIHIKRKAKAVRMMEYSQNHSNGVGIILLSRKKGGMSLKGLKKWLK